MFNLVLGLGTCLFIVCTQLKVEAIPITTEVLNICKLLPANTKILRNNSCTDWAECSYEGEVIDEGSCLEGWFFDRNTGKCSKSSKVDCPFLKSGKSACAGVKDGTYMEHPESCNKFIYCHQNVEKYSSCPNGLNFDPNSQSCVYPNVYSCPEAEERGAANDICKIVGDHVRIANPDSCTSFMQCSKGFLKITNCIAGTYFNRETGKCGEKTDTDCGFEEPLTEAPSNTICGTDEAPIVGFISDGISCSGYYYCDELESGKADRKPIHGKCTSGKFFDTNSFSCKDRTNVRCLYDRCEGMNKKFVNVQGNCTKYTYCNDGKSVSNGDCPENFYFDEKSQVCTKNVITYMACVE